MTKDTISAITAILHSNLNVIQDRENEYLREIKMLRAALERILDCDYPRSVDTMQQIAREALDTRI